MNGSSAQCQRLMHSLLIFGLLQGCGQQELSRSKAEDLLGTSLSEQIKKECSLNSRLRTKPEFTTMKNTTFCHGEASVSGLVRDSETKYTVEFRAVVNYDHEALSDWNAAFARLEQRLAKIEGKHSKAALSSNVLYVDDSDGQEFHYTYFTLGPAPTIFDTGEWAELQKLREAVVGMMENPRHESDVMYAPVILYDDGWRVGYAPD